MRISDWSSDVCSSDLWLNSSITLPISGETESMASLKAKPSALLAVAFSIAMISLALMKEKLPLKRSIPPHPARSEEHTSELQSLMRISYAVFCLKKKHKTEQQ